MSNRRASRFFLFLTLTSILLAPDCATITRRSTQKIPVTSSPAGAMVSVNGVPQGITPVEVKLTRTVKNQIVRIESPGYDAVEIRPKRRTAARRNLLFPSELNSPSRH